MPNRPRPIGRPSAAAYFARLPQPVEGYVIPDLPPLPVEVAVEVTRFARWRLTDWEESQNDRA